MDRQQRHVAPGSLARRQRALVMEISVLLKDKRTPQLCVLVFVAVIYPPPPHPPAVRLMVGLGARRGRARGARPSRSARKSLGGMTLPVCFERVRM